ncbi:hypothetical protein CDAR_598361 [Caerostris darwini]|uniref:Uncharacterized protein n=1 Tax=Caerostris darwini TaxID=1538125 RepID=A0AAV4QN71_9ARAC|nr:hypothetical protein CDAR_598361 [Caerostris darwini]
MIHSNEKRHPGDVPGMARRQSCSRANIPHSSVTPCCQIPIAKETSFSLFRATAGAGCRSNSSFEAGVSNPDDLAGYFGNAP